MDMIVCPHCHKTFPASEVFTHELTEVKKKLLAEFEKEKREVEFKMRKKIEEELELKVKNAQNETNEAKESSKKLRDELLQEKQLTRKLQEQKENVQLEAQKKFDDELRKAKETITKNEQEKINEEKMQILKQLEDTKKALEEAKRKANQTSQQLQGEVQELNLEQKLNDVFPSDEIRPIKKGTEGGDILHIIRNSSGLICGSILWEIKQTKSWSRAWLSKLREDMRQADASTCVLVSHVLPPEVQTFGSVERVWVTSNQYAVPLAYVLRSALLKIAEAKVATEHKEEKMELLSKYITSETFIHRFEAQAEAVVNLEKNLRRERDALRVIWKQREIEIERLMNGLSDMYGEFKGIMGQALPTIKSFELSEGGKEENHNG